MCGSEREYPGSGEPARLRDPPSLDGNSNTRSRFSGDGLGTISATFRPVVLDRVHKSTYNFCVSAWNLPGQTRPTAFVVFVC